MFNWLLVRITGNKTAGNPWPDHSPTRIVHRHDCPVDGKNDRGTVSTGSVGKIVSKEGVGEKQVLLVAMTAGALAPRPLSGLRNVQARRRSRPSNNSRPLASSGSAAGTGTTVTWAPDTTSAVNARPSASDNASTSIPTCELPRAVAVKNRLNRVKLPAC